MKSGRLIVVAFSGLALHSAAHAEGVKNSSPAVFFVEQAAASVAKVGQAATAATRKIGQQIVRASWYGGGERLNRRTSTGEIFRPMGQTAAHRTLPLGTLLRLAEAADEGGDAAAIALAPDAPAGFAALTPDVLSELNLSAAAWFGAHIAEVVVRGA